MLADILQYIHVCVSEESCQLIGLIERSRHPCLHAQRLASELPLVSGSPHVRVIRISPTSRLVCVVFTQLDPRLGFG